MVKNVLLHARTSSGDLDDAVASAANGGGSGAQSSFMRVSHVSSQADYGDSPVNRSTAQEIELVGGQAVAGAVPSSPFSAEAPRDLRLAGSTAKPHVTPGKYDALPLLASQDDEFDALSSNIDRV